MNSPPSLRCDSELARTVWGEARYCIDAFGCRPHSMALVRVLAHIKKLDDCFGDFLVRVSCLCGKKAAEVAGVATPRSRGIPKNPH